MQFHRSILGHAEAATSRMLDKVVDATRDFDLIEIEGDAAFLSRDAEGLDAPATLSAITQAAVGMPCLSRGAPARRAQHVPLRELYAGRAP